MATVKISKIIRNLTRTVSKGISIFKIKKIGKLKELSKKAITIGSS